MDGMHLTSRLPKPIDLMVLLTIAAALNQYSDANIYEVATFSDADSYGFNHLTIHNVTGKVYIGGVNRLYRLNEALDLIVSITTGPEYDGDGEEYDTFNKIMTIDNDNDDLITCGGYRGDCQKRDIYTLSVIGSNDDPVFVVSNKTYESTVGFIAPNYHLGQPLLYVGTTSTSENPGRPFVSGRQVEGNQIFEVVEDHGGNTRVDVALAFTATFPVRYVAGFSYNGYSYFVTTQKSSTDTSSDYISKLVRVCQETDQYYFNSYTEVTLRCRDDSYNLAQAAYLTRPGKDLSQSMKLNGDEEVLFVAFAEGSNDPPTPEANSAICMYKMSDIETAFQDAAKGCMEGDGLPATTASWMQGASCAGSLPFLRGTHECFALTYYQYANGVDDQHGYDVEDYTDTLVTSIAVTTVQQHTVGFLGTDTGTILKVHFINNISANTYEEIEFKDSTKPVLQDMVFDRDEEHFYTFTDAIVRKVKVEQCSQYTTCSDCVGSRDPYCGWCASDRSCSTYARCTESDPSPYWPNVFDNVACTIIESVEPEDGTPIDVSSKITLHVVGLPDIGDGESYSCAFDGYVTTAVSEGQTLTCDTPPIDDRLTIPLGEDHATVVLQIRSGMTVLANEDFHYYDCSRHDSCSRCVTSNWACNWCVYENRCIHYLASCPTDDTSSIVVGSNNKLNSTDIKGESFCPQLAEQPGKLLIPVDTDTEIQLSTMNIYDNKDLGGYVCVLTVKNTLLSIGATRNDENSVTCNAKKYTYQSTQQELPVNLTLQWNDGENIVDDIHGYTVTLYKCNVGRDNCRDCLSNNTTTNPLSCGWCECGSKCEYVEHCESDCFETDEAKCPSDGSTRTCAFVLSAFVVWLSYCIINTTQE